MDLTCPGCSAAVDEYELCRHPSPTCALCCANGECGNHWRDVEKRETA